MSAAAVAAFAAVAGLALAMVYAMVQWCAALLQAPLPPEGEPLLPSALRQPAVWRWGAIYAAVWIALIGAFLALFRAAGDRQPGRRLALLLAIAAGWSGLSLLFVWFGRGLARAGERQARAAAAGSDAGDGAEAISAGGPEPLLPDSPPPAPASRARDLAGQVAWLAGVLLLVTLGQTWPPLARLGAYFHLHQRAYLLPLVTLGALGFVLFLGSAIAMVLAEGRPMSRQEIEALERRALRRQLGAGAGRIAVRLPRLAVGAEAEDGASFADVKAAFRARAWEVSPRWRRLFLAMTGAAFLLVGLFGAGIVLAPAGFKLVLAGALLYAGVRTVRGFARA
jgi:hypothetical protein